MKKAPVKNIDDIINAVIALYLTLIRFNKKELSKNDIEKIYNIIKTTFRQEEIHIHHIERLIENPLPLKQAINIIKNDLRFPDKITLLMNLLLIAHISDDFSVMDRLDILEVVELLEIDIRLYSQIIEVIEEEKDFIEISLQEFLLNIEKNLFMNFLLLGESTDCDILLRDENHTPYKIIILIIEDLILVGSYVDDMYRIGSQSLKKNVLFKLKKDETIILKNHTGNNATEISYHDILKLYHNKVEEVAKVIKYTKESFGVDFKQDKNKLKIEIFDGKIMQDETLLTKGSTYEFMITDRLIINDVIKLSSLDILTEKLTFARDERRFDTLFLESYEDFFRMNKHKSPHALLRISQKDDKHVISPLIKTPQIYLNHQPLEKEEAFELSKDVVTIGKTTIRFNKFFDINKVELEVIKMEVNNLHYIFKDDNKVALDEINFYVKRGEFLSILGPSGSGKTTLLKCLIGEIIPDTASIFINDFDFFKNYSYFQKYIGYVPQDDLLFNNLTVYENLFYCGKLRLPHIRDARELKKKIDNILMQIGLSEKRDLVVGSIMDKKLSGGERKRLNIALELLAEPLIIILDEPTSGLSSKDSEKITDILNELKEQGKIIIATIHQPNPDIFQKFDKVLLIDQQGTEVFFGNTEEVFGYFNDEIEQISYGLGNLLRKKELKMAEYLFDIMQYPLLDAEGNPVYKRSNSIEGAREELRKFPPNHWKAKFEKYQLFELMKRKMQDKSEEEKEPVSKKTISHKRTSIREYFSQFYFLFARNVLNKLKNKTNLIVTFIAAPFLAILISFVLRYSPPGQSYSFAANVNMKIFIFISIIVFIFLGLSNSLDEIISEKRILIREKKLRIKCGLFILVKNLTLAIFAFFQAVIYFAISSVILEISGVFFVYVGYLILSAVIGFSLGLLASALIKDIKAMINILPIVLIPQMIFAGAVIEFEKMNRVAKVNPESVIPEFCHIMPSRWLFEGLFTAQAKLNFYKRKLGNLNNRENVLYQQKSDKEISISEFNQEIKYVRERKAKLLFNNNPDNYINEDINIAVSRIDGRFLNDPKNHFLSSKKIFFGKIYNTYNINVVIALLYSFLINILTYIIIRFKFK